MRTPASVHVRINTSYYCWLIYELIAVSRTTLVARQLVGTCAVYGCNHSKLTGFNVAQCTFSQRILNLVKKAFTVFLYVHTLTYRQRVGRCGVSLSILVQCVIIYTWSTPEVGVRAGSRWTIGSVSILISK